MRKGDYIRSTSAYKREMRLLAINYRLGYILKYIGSGKKVLDLGCCSGGISDLIAKSGNEVTGVEADGESANLARSRGINVVEHDLDEGIPFSDATFDVAHAGEILEHLYDTKFFLQEINRVLIPGGILLLSTPNLNSLLNRIAVPLGFHIHFLGPYLEDVHGDHIRIFNVGKLERLLNATGFKVLDVKGISYSPWPFFWLFVSFPTLADLILVRAVKGEDSHFHGASKKLDVMRIL